MSDKVLHLVRHGEVHNPDGVLYGRLPNYKLSELGEQMAAAAAAELKASQRPIAKLMASPLLRAQQSAAPIAKTFGLDIHTEERIIEPTNDFEGTVAKQAFKSPKNWHLLLNPLKPSWGEPYRSIADRVLQAMDEAWQAAEDAAATGDIVMVSHQAVIWAAHRDIAGETLWHNPAKRRCELSSITSFVKQNGKWQEVQYRTPAAELMDGSIDVGAV